MQVRSDTTNLVFSMQLGSTLTVDSALRYAAAILCAVSHWLSLRIAPLSERVTGHHDNSQRPLFKPLNDQAERRVLLSLTALVKVSVLVSAILQRAPATRSLTRTSAEHLQAANVDKSPVLAFEEVLAQLCTCTADGDCLQEEDGTVIVRDDLDLLLQVLVPIALLPARCKVFTSSKNMCKSTYHQFCLAGTPGEPQGFADVPQQ